MFFEGDCHICSCVKLPSQGKFTLGSYLCNMPVRHRIHKCEPVFFPEKFSILG